MAIKSSVLRRDHFRFRTKMSPGSHFNARQSRSEGRIEVIKSPASTQTR